MDSTQTYSFNVSWKTRKLVKKLTRNHGNDIPKEETPLVRTYIAAIRSDGLMKALSFSKDVELKIPISRATANRRNKQLVSDILVVDIKKETGLKGFLHDV